MSAGANTPAPSGNEFMLGQIVAKLDGIQATLTADRQRTDGIENRVQGLEQLAAARASFAADLMDVKQRVNDLEASRDQAKGGFSIVKIISPVASAIVAWLASQFIHLR